MVYGCLSGRGGVSGEMRPKEEEEIVGELTQTTQEKFLEDSKNDAVVF